MKEAVISYATSLGFQKVGFTSAAPFEDAESALLDWIRSGNAAGLHYMVKEPAKRARPSEALPGAKSIIALAASYYTPSPQPRPPLTGPAHVNEELFMGGPSPTEGRGEGGIAIGKVARYAWGKDYHKVLGKRLDALVRYLEMLAPGERFKTYVDTGPLLERAIAQRAGIGFFGKNTNILTRRLGSWVFLANVLTTLDLAPDAPDMRSCGDCRLCINACPTHALDTPYALDARRCISYLTIELQESVPEALRGKLSDWIFGCDICQEVCPHNRKVEETAIQEFQPTRGVGPTLSLEDILSIRDDAAFEKRFAGTPLLRARRRGLLRSACLLAAEERDPRFTPYLERLVSIDPDPIIREHAAYALRIAQDVPLPTSREG